MNNNSGMFYAVHLEASGLHRGQPFAGLALGLFTDMYGFEVDLREIKLADIVRNTQDAIAAALAKKMPGLPIDAANHDKGQAAGWIVSCEAGEVKDGEGVTLPAAILVADWTQLGQRLIREKTLANFSPTVQLEPIPVIRGGSLTNWPASVDATGTPLFDALELSQGTTPRATRDDQQSLEDIAMPQDMNGAGGDGASTVPAAQENQLTAELSALIDQALETRLAQLQAQVTAMASAAAPAPAQTPVATATPQGDTDSDPAEQGRLLALARSLGLQTDPAQTITQEHLDELSRIYAEQGRLQWSRKLAALRRENSVTELAASLVGGSPTVPRGIPAEEAELRQQLLKLPPDSFTYFSELLQEVVRQGLVDFSEIGSGRRQHGTRQLPIEYANALRRGELELKDLENAILAPDLGPISAYDLSEWDQ